MLQVSVFKRLAVFAHTIVNVFGIEELPEFWEEFWLIGESGIRRDRVKALHSKDDASIYGKRGGFLLRIH